MPIKRVPGKDRKFIEDTIRALDSQSVKVGWVKANRYPDGTLVASIAAQNEFGNSAKNIPPRPFMRPTITEKKTEWKGIFSSLIRSALKGSRNPMTIYETFGLKAAAHIRNTIAKLLTPALNEKTIKARQERRANKRTVGLLTKPLIDTKLMYGTLTSEVSNDTRK